jgi:glutamyl-tRNA reductase
MTADQELAVEALTRGIVNKIMHTPISTLKTAARDPESTTVIDLVRRLFNLRDNPHDNIPDTLHDEEEGKGAAASKSAPGRGAGKGPGD